MNTEYDYVIAGGGSAGCTLAARLAEDPSLKAQQQRWRERRRQSA